MENIAINYARINPAQFWGYPWHCSSTMVLFVKFWSCQALFSTCRVSIELWIPRCKLACKAAKGGVMKDYAAQHAAFQGQSWVTGVVGNVYIRICDNSWIFLNLKCNLCLLLNNRTKINFASHPCCKSFYNPFIFQLLFLITKSGVLVLQAAIHHMLQKICKRNCQKQLIQDQSSAK